MIQQAAIILIAGLSHVSTARGTTPLFAADLSSALEEHGDTGIVLVDMPKLQPDREELYFDLIDHPGLVAERTSAEVREDGTLVWHGHVRDHGPWSEVQLLRRGDKVVGKFHVDDTTYLLRPAGQGRHELRIGNDDGGDTVDALPAVHASPDASRAKPSNADKDAAGHDVVSLHVAYSAQAWKEMRVPRQETLAMIDEVNTGLARSGATFRLELAGVQRTSLGEFSRLRDAMAGLASAAPSFEEIRLQREAVKGDLVALVVSRGDTCGVANHHVDHPRVGFSVVRLDCARHQLGLAQAIGHNLGAFTDAGHGRNPRRPEGHALAIPGVMRTVMAGDCGRRACPKENVWSSPGVSLRDERGGVTWLGVEGASDNVGVMNRRAAVVAGFR